MVRIVRMVRIVKMVTVMIMIMMMMMMMKFMMMLIMAMKMTMKNANILKQVTESIIPSFDHPINLHVPTSLLQRIEAK